jgi:indole-3-glycerol phosphate synthase
VSARPATYLDRIVSAHRERAAHDLRSLASVQAQAQSVSGATRGFRSTLAVPGLSVIAEIKRRSPSKGDLFAGLDPVTVAKQYSDGGAAALSVLTDEEHFGGSISDLQAARNAVSVPVLRKDFTVDLRDVCDARVMGADCVLLIVAALDDEELRDFHDAAHELGLDALVETHDEGEVERALGVGATLIGVNQRDLHTFQVDQERAVRVAKSIPQGVVKVAESGVRGSEDAAVLFAAGFDAVLVGESLVTSGDPTAATRALREAAHAK